MHQTSWFICQKIPPVINEIPMEIYKKTNVFSRKAWFAVLNCYKTTIFSIYYLRPRTLNADLILDKFNQNLTIARKIAQKRNSNLLNNICLPRESFFNIISLPKIHKRVMCDTSVFRNEDKQIRRAVFLDANRNGNQLHANVPKRRKGKMTKPFSDQKRQILISEAFKKMQNKPRTIGGNLELSMKTQ